METLFEFDLDDLEDNRKGILSPRQKQRIEKMRKIRLQSLVKEISVYLFFSFVFILDFLIFQVGLIAFLIIFIIVVLYNFLESYIHNRPILGLNALFIVFNKDYNVIEFCVDVHSFNVKHFYDLDYFEFFQQTWFKTYSWYSYVAKEKYFIYESDDYSLTLVEEQYNALKANEKLLIYCYLVHDVAYPLSVEIP